MAQTQRSQGSPDPEATGGMSDAPELWGNGGLVGDGRYRLTRRLGRGGMAEVFAAEDVRLGRTVAVKLLRADLAEDPVSKARFTREAQSVAGLNHHAVVAVYDSGEDVVAGNTVPYIVMELVEGRTIRDLLINAEAPGPEQALIIVSGVLEALAYSHQHGIVHRDIKPANVIITGTGAVKVMDFGIARALHGAQSTITQTGMVMGTPQYLSPEQALGKAVDHRSDLYATGCLLYELLALRPPFIGETPLAVVYQHVQDLPVPPSEYAEDSPPELDGLAMRSLAKDPDDRFQTAEEMRALVQYGLQMLYEKGSHNGTWATGPVSAHDGRDTPAMGVGSTSAMSHPDYGTRPVPQPGRPAGGNDGFAGGGSHRDDGGGRHGRGWIWALLLLALIGLGVGLGLALSGDDGKKTPGPSTSSTTPAEKTSEPTKEPTEETTDEVTEPGGNTDGGTDVTPTEQSPTESATEESPSTSPTEQSPSESATEGSPTEEEPTEDPTDASPSGSDGGEASGPGIPTGEVSEDPGGEEG